jgi:ABC-type branched-subunit amino acid transport system permease subunit
MFPNIIISLVGGLIPAIINAATGKGPSDNTEITKRAAGSGIIITPTAANTGIAGMIASTAIMVLGAAGLGDFTHTIMFALGAIGTVATTVSHLHLIGSSNDNTLAVVGNLLQQVAQAGGVPQEVILTEEPAPVTVTLTASPSASGEPLPAV